MNWTRLGRAVCAGLCITCGMAAAQTQDAAAAARLGWQQAVESAWARAQARPEARARLLGAQALREAARSPWAAPPAVEVEHLSGRGNGERQRESQAGVSWPLWLPGQRQARLNAADAEQQAASASLDAARWRLAAEVHQAGLALREQQAQAKEADVQVNLLKALADDVDRRVRAGDLARADAMAAQAELLQARTQARQAQLRVQEARERWRLLTGMDSVPVGAVPDAAAHAEHPELRAARAAVERARRVLEDASLSRREPPVLSVRVRREADATGAMNSAGVALRWPLGTSGANALQLAQARGALEVAEAEEARVRDRLAVEAQTARLQAQTAAAQLDAERERAALLRERAKLIDTSFRAGETALPDYLRALGAATQADAAVLRQEAALQQAQARLLQFTGVAP